LARPVELDGIGSRPYALQHVEPVEQGLQRNLVAGEAQPRLVAADLE
jgi:hypothetical protein